MNILNESQKEFFDEFRDLLVKHSIQFESYLEIIKDGQQFNIFFSCATNELSIKFSKLNHVKLTKNGWDNK